jgi:hypothetical protein
LKDLCHGLLQLRRRQFLGTLNGEDLVTTIRFRYRLIPGLW